MLKRTLKQTFGIAVVAMIGTIEISHSLHKVEEGDNNPSHGRRNEENRTILETNMERVRNRSNSNIRASGELHQEFHDEVISHDEMCLCQRYPEFSFPKGFCLTA